MFELFFVLLVIDDLFMFWFGCVVVIVLFDDDVVICIDEFVWEGYDIVFVGFCFFLKKIIRILDIDIFIVFVEKVKIFVYGIIIVINILYVF